MGGSRLVAVAVFWSLAAAALAADNHNHNHTCTTKVAFTETAFDVEYMPVMRSYYAKCWGRRCSKTRVYWQTVKTSKVVQKYRTEVECCPGYSRSTPSHSCLPVCEGGCPERQQCSAPGRCTCEEGYLPGPDQKSCLSLCELRGCQHGHCTDPYTCVCDPGYSKQDGGECEPVCAAGCGRNARCEAPGRCSCLEGFGNLDSSGCRPLCRLQLRGAECVATERYQCLLGYVFDKQTATEYTCRPTCKEKCENGECVAPDTCGCLEGYELAGNFTCRPICEFVCSHGDCVAPNTCRCHPGYQLDVQDATNSTCVPTCQVDCINGYCTAPDTCTCFDGFAGPVPSNSSIETSSGASISPEASEDLLNNTCLPVCSPDCRYATCVLPDTCECLDGYEPDPADATNSTCRPTCEATCVNANCTAPNTCSCLEGFHPDPGDASNSTCLLLSQSLELCTGEGCHESGVPYCCSERRRLLLRTSGRSVAAACELSDSEAPLETQNYLRDHCSVVVPTGESRRPVVVAAGVGAVALLVLASAVAAAVCWLRRRRRGAQGLLDQPAVAGGERYSNPAFTDDEQLHFNEHLLEESNVDSDD